MTAVIGPRRVATSRAASGIWTMDQHAQEVASNTWPGPPDPYRANVVAHLSFDQDEGLIDSIGHTLTNTGVLFSNSYSAFGKSSGLFYGAQSLQLDGSTDFSLGTGDCAIEFWLKALQTQGDRFIVGLRASGSATGLHVTFNPSGYLQATDGVATAVASGTTRIDDGNPHFCCVQRVSGVVYIGIDGVERGSGTMATNWTTGSNRPRIGANDFNATASNNFALMYLDELRITRGVGRDHTVVPTTPFPRY